MEMAQNIGLPPSDAKRQVTRGLERGYTNPRVAPERFTFETATDVKVAILTWWGQVSGHGWNGRWRNTSLRILAGWRDLTERVGKVELQASFRQIVQGSGVSISTVVAHRSDWSKFVRQTKKGNRVTGEASTWKRAIANPNKSVAIPSGVSRLFGNATPQSNAWHGRSLSWRFHDELSDEGITAAELARRVGVHPSTAGRHLHRMAIDGLAKKDGDGLWTLGSGKPEDLELVGIDHAAERRERHRLDREQAKKWRAARLSERERER
jgi:DNA-binding transcriptional ArsR family regulator